jgi:ferredoxin-NADP reductase
MKLTLIEKRQETADVVSYIFKPEQPVTWTAGQYFRFKIEDPNADNRGNNRFFTCAASPFEGNIMLTTRFAKEKGSSFKNFLHGLEINQTIEATGPNGEFTLPNPETGKQYVFIAGGIGITPYRSILLQLDHEGKPMPITLLYANRDQNIVYKQTFDDLATKHQDFKVNYVLDPQRIDQQTLSTVYSLQSTVFFISGPEPMVGGIKDILLGMGVPEPQIITDYFPGY